MANVEYTKSARRQVESYRNEVEGWKADHDEAMLCMDFEILLRHGIYVHEVINHVDEALLSASRSGKIEYTDEQSEAVKILYEWWYAPCDKVLENLERFEAADFTVSYASEFRSAMREVRGLLTPDAEFFGHPQLVDARDEAIDAFRKNECEPFDAR